MVFMARGKGRGLGLIAVVLVGLLLAFVGYVRLSPVDPAAWHQPVEQAEDADLAGGAVRVIDGGEEQLQRIDAIPRELPRTEILAGSVAAGHITYITRSAVFGFPDMTTVERRGDQIRMYARLRFGASDLGVNRERLERVIATLQGG